jgi:glycerophosphoryl diester phosphodiesterase
LRELSRYAGRTTMILEVKRGDWADILLAEVAGWPNIVIASFDHALIAELARRKVSFPLGLTIAGTIVDLPAYAHRLGATWCFPDHHYVDAVMVRRLHERDVRVVPWTPNRARDWNSLRDIGCDGIITDYPAEATLWRVQSG